MHAWILVVSSSLYFWKSVFSFRADSILKSDGDFISNWKFPDCVHFFGAWARQAVDRTWQGINHLLNRCKRKRKSVGKLKDPDNNNNLTNDSSRIPNILNKHFSNVGNILASKLPPVKRLFTDYLRKSSSPELSFFFKPVTPSKIQIQILSIPNSKSHGLYFCPSQLLKYWSDAISPVLSDILNTFVTLGTYPKNLKCQKLYLSSKLTTRPTLLIIGQFHYYQISIESSKKLCTTEWETLLKSTAYYIRLNMVFVKLTQPNMLFLIW